MNVNGSILNNLEEISKIKRDSNCDNEKNCKNEYTKKLEEELKDFACKADVFIDTSK